MGVKGPTLAKNEDLKEVYAKVCKAMPDGCIVAVQNICRVKPYGELFHAPVISGSAQLQGLLDTGSMVCTTSKEAEQRLIREHFDTAARCDRTHHMSWL